MRTRNCMQSLGLAWARGLRRALACGLLALVASGPAAAADVPGELIVMLREGSDVAPLLVKYQLSLLARFGQRPIYRLKVIGPANVALKLAALLRESSVLLAEANTTYRVFEPKKNVAWAIGDPSAAPGSQWARSAIHLDEAQQRSTGAGIRVAVLDTGVDRNHPALAGKLLPGFDFVDWDNDPSEGHDPAARSYGHGTHVAGLVAMVAPDAKIMPLRILDDEGNGNIWVLAEALLHAVDPDGDPRTDDGAHVINLSIGTQTRTQFFSAVLGSVSCLFNGLGLGWLPGWWWSSADAPAIDQLRCSGIGGAVIVAAAGNDASDRVRQYPAAETSLALLAVAASDPARELADFSNYGWPGLAAPGDGIISSVPGGGYASWSGTSMAAPLVAGTAALMRAQNRNLTAAQVVWRLRGRSSDLCGTWMRQLDAEAALADRASRTPNCGR